ncbi:MAG: hypothetical protein A3C35_02390 [Omnitrophica bacterium RIFCSPHIGHO2_02_FULL_46_11]|nr:MAG: hypothetical protein A3C35_02390 [Omnitrophica bacterium RIFCSPHIGHO2_02_FULL_46_11]OGW87203.1 MAG: hypothetical protein A3A81_08070 [Omnitrophica bacterium RIFCSPLOWO2_01_FULL_45_10b]
MFLHLKNQRLLLFSILALAFLVRIVGIQFGLPNLYHADEPIIVNHAMAYGTGDFNPHFFKIPPLVSYLLFVVYTFYFLIGKGLGCFSTVDNFADLFLANSTSFYLIARILFGTVIGTFTVYFLYRLAKKYFSSIQALISSFFLAFCFLHVRDSHYIYTDITLVLILVLCFFPIFQVLEKASRRAYVLFGILAGVAVATKYNGVIIFVPFILAHCLKNRFKLRSLINFNLFLSASSSFLVYSLLNPFGWLDFRFFLDELLRQGKAEAASGFLHHFTYSLNGALGFPLLALSSIGCFIAMFQYDQKKWTLLSFMFIYYVILCFKSQPYDRYVLPLIPFLLLFAAEGLIWIKEKFNLSNALFFIFSFVVAAPPIVKISLSDYLFIQKDIRTVSREWIERSIPSDTKIALDASVYMPRLKPSLNQLIQKRQAIAAARSTMQLKRIDLLIKQAKQDKSAHYDLFFLSETSPNGKFLFSKPSISYDLNRLKESGVEYVVTSWANEKDKDQFFKDLASQTTLIAKFTPYRDQMRELPIDNLALTGGPFLWDELIARETNGQIIKVYRLK